MQIVIYIAIFLVSAIIFTFVGMAIRKKVAESKVGSAEEELYNKIWNDVKKINQELTNYKHIKKLIISNEPMIKTTTAKIKRFEEIKKEKIK